MPHASGPTDDADERFIDRIAGGDLDALEGLYERYRTMAYSIALRITGEPSAAEDVVRVLSNEGARHPAPLLPSVA